MTLLFASTAFAQEQQQVVLAVFDVEDKGAGLGGDTISNLTDYLVVLLTEAGYQVVPREQVKERILDAKKESYKACYDQACQIELGRELSAHKAFTTQLIKVGNKCRLVSLLLDLKKATTEKSFKVPSDCGEETLLEAVEKLVAGFAGKVQETPPAAAQPAPTPSAPAEPPSRFSPAPATPPAEGELAKEAALKRLAEAGSRRVGAYLGVTVRALDPQNDQPAGLQPGQKGLMIVQVMENSPASRAGIIPGDVILSANNVQIDNSFAFSRLVQRMSRGSNLDLEILRGGSQERLQIALEQAPATQPEPAAAAPTTPPESKARLSLPPESKAQPSPPAERVPVQHGHLGFQIGPVFKNLYSPASLSDVSLGGDIYSADISTGDGFFTELTIDGHIDRIFSLGFGLFYLFNNNLSHAGDRISYLAPTFLFRLNVAFTDWLEARTEMELGSGVHLGSKLTLWKDDTNSRTISLLNDWEQIFFKAGQNIVVYLTNEIGVSVSAGVLFSSGYLDIEGKEYSFGLPVIVFLSAGAEWR